jgi:hypothetical protein
MISAKKEKARASRALEKRSRDVQILRRYNPSLFSNSLIWLSGTALLQ